LIILPEINKETEVSGRKLPTMDLLTASIVMAHGATLITRDEHFKDIEGLGVVIV